MLIIAVVAYAIPVLKAELFGLAHSLFCLVHFKRLLIGPCPFSCSTFWPVSLTWLPLPLSKIRVRDLSIMQWTNISRETSQTVIIQSSRLKWAKFLSHCVALCDKTQVTTRSNTEHKNDTSSFSRRSAFKLWTVSNRLMGHTLSHSQKQ